MNDPVPDQESAPATAADPSELRRYLVHYSEVGLKGANRGRFEERLIRNIYRAARGLAVESVRRLYGRFLLEQRVEGSAEDLERRLARTYGVSSFAPVVVTAADLEPVRAILAEWASDADFESFAIRARRLDKAFPVDSQTLNVELGALVGRISGARVDLNDPSRCFEVLVLGSEIYLSRDRRPGPGGLPSGLGSRVAVLLSGGIDSPVAAERLLRRGCELVFIHFHSSPFTDRSSIDKARELAQIVSAHRNPAPFYAVPLAEVQRRIVAGAPADYRVILYRRYMLRIAAKIAEKEWCQALATGEAIGQVASQTVDNLGTLDRTVDLPVLRPLLTYDKDEIVREARRAGTFEVSIEPHSDCCSYLMPRRPVTRSRDWKVSEIEAKLEKDGELPELVQAIVDECTPESVGPSPRRKEDPCTSES